MSDAFTISPLPVPTPAIMMRQIDEIFFTSSLRTKFADETERAVFRECWLGRYLANEPENAFIAMSGAGEAIGYIVGALDDPARNARYSDIDYFATLADVTPDYPAHLHINVHRGWRSRGVGAALIESFCAHAAAAGVPGAHLVTGATSRNLSFYARSGFRPIRHADWRGAQIVMLGRSLGRTIS